MQLTDEMEFTSDLILNFMLKTKNEDYPPKTEFF